MGSAAAAAVEDDVAVANGFSPCSPVKLLNWGRGGQRVADPPLMCTLTSWEEEEAGGGRGFFMDYW
ncbi:hypothetical protein EYF80_060054 [Liparis tanakae]|uniref:Uncharacterized protein n=1 Tax=Liparis tanakae TaxID=230148 RepID=A0A4Z2ELG1_9TELE|nr:hypothetical protein EYF80_060054 [Liparis tanakae]